ncbi:unnamed protein product [Spirodela intermedia]|uniref:Telomerase reverse transcriptase n=1 Tax=Spirodela intermedia TaxID=51605 RepID=A0A7I8IAV0_SPIIN|nr:unnamed protein product [Spirodela intermedia]CAA6654698.1 unnamed protein product [Spirodela intermedia]
MELTYEFDLAAEKNTVIEKKLQKKFLGLHKTSENIHSEFLYAGTKKVNHLKQSLHESNSVDRGFLAAETKSYCEHKEVVSFIWAATRSIVPVDLLGDYSNWRSLRRNISKFVRLRRFETFCLRQCVNRLQTSKFSFLSRIPNRPLCYCFSKEGSTMVKNCWESKDDWIVLKHKLFHGWIFWFFSCMVVPMLGANFYVTESEFGKHEALYYPKPVWTTLLARTMSCLKKQNYCPIDLKYFAKITSSRPFGFSKVRFLPKEKGMRLLANLKAPSKAWLLAKSSFCDHIAKTSDKSITRLKGRNSNRKLKLVHFRSVNSALHDVHAILKRIKSEHPLMVGASVFDYNDVYQVLYGFLARLKNGSTTVPKVFIVVADVSKAFDSINQDRLLDVMKDVIWKKEYLLRKYAQVICTKKTMSTRYGYVCVDRNEDHDIANSLTSIRSCSSHGIITDQGILKKIKHAEIHHLLREHVKSNILQLGRDFCLQRSGISQGSLLSSLLCSFYYGHLERSIIFPFLRKIPQLPHASSSSSNAKEPAIEGIARDDGNTEDPSSPQHILLRLVDDFLFISSSEKQARGFFNRLCRGFREYNCYMNSEKFGLNFDVGGKSQPRSNRRYVGADGIPFLPWSGLLVNCLTLEIQADYTRYLGSHLRSTLTVHAHAKVGEHLGEKLCNYMRPKCHPLFYDSYINSPAVVRLNAYQAFLLCAMKFHSYLRALPNCRLGPSRCLEIIQSYMHRLIKKRMYGVGRRKLDFVPALRLKKVETVWLGLSAYIRVLRKKQSRHGELLLLLGGALEGLGRLEGCDPSHLEYAVDDSHSSLFWQIKREELLAGKREQSERRKTRRMVRTAERRWPSRSVAAVTEGALMIGPPVRRRGEPGPSVSAL